MILMYLGATAPAPPVPPDISDTLLHLVGHAVLAVLLARAVAGGLPSRITARTAALAVAVAVAYGAALEGRQALVATRTAELADVYANAAGACVGTFACWVWGIIASRRVPRHGAARHER